MTAFVRLICRDRRGASALEFALVSPLFIAMMFAIFYTGMAYYCDASVRHAVQKESRMLILDPTTSATALQDAVVADLNDVPVNNVAVTLETEKADSNESVSRISWSYNFLLSAPLLPNYQITGQSSIVVPMLTTN